jgi:predicted nucleotidyltransferase
VTILEDHIEEIKRLCSKHNVKQLYVFGSVISNKFNDKSDVDLIVDFDSIDVAYYADNYYDFKYSLQDLLQKPVDLLEEKAIRNPYFREVIEKQRQLIYG